MIKTKIFRGTGTQVPVYATTPATFSEAFIAEKPLIAADAADLVETDLTASAGGVGTLVVRPLKAVGDSGYTAPDPDASGTPVLVQDNTEQNASFVKILKVNGNYPYTEGQDVFLQIWSYPVAATVGSADDSTTTGTLSDGDTSSAVHTLIHSQRIFENLMFEIKFHRAIQVRNAIVCISNKELSFDITSPTIDETNFMVEIEDVETFQSYE